MATADLRRLLHGSDAPLGEARALRAGQVEMLLDGVELRYLRTGSTELVRRIYVAVRDPTWDTIPGTVERLDVDDRGDAFEVAFRLRHASPELELSWDGSIRGETDGRVTYSFAGTAARDFDYGRIGICLHHPWRETAGRPFRASSPEGELTGAFPSLIGPQRFAGGTFHALFDPFDRLEVDLGDGASLLLELEGDLFESEDHRNWTDANFKTYSTPLSRGARHSVSAGTRIEQRVAVTPRLPAPRPRTAGPVRLELGADPIAVFPPVGLGADADRHELSTREAELLGGLAPAHLRVDVDLTREDWPAALAHAQGVAGRLDCALELGVLVAAGDADALREVAAALAGGPSLARVVVIRSGQTGMLAPPPAPEHVALVRSTLALGDGVPVLGGTDRCFTELNRQPPDTTGWDGLCYSITPQIHAFADVDLVETLEAQGETVRTALARGDGLPVTVSRVLLSRRGPGDAPARPGALPVSVDARQSSLFGAVWTAGSLKYLAEAGAATLTYYASTGWRGVLERAEGSADPERFHSRPHETFPLFVPLVDATGWRGADVLPCTSSEPLTAIGLAVRDDDDAMRLLVANLTPEPQAVTLAGVSGDVVLRRLNADTAALAAADTAAFLASGETAAADTLELAPYELVRIDRA